VVDAWQMMLFGVLGIALLSAFAVAYFLRAG
jgi:hypothetical protein